MIGTRLHNSPRAEKVYRGAGSLRSLRSVFTCVDTYVKFITERFNMAWDTYRRGRHLSIQLPSSVKNELIKIKARGGCTLTEQIVSALQAQWSEAAPAGVQPQNSVPPQRLAPPGLAPGTTLYHGQVYRVQRPNDPKIPKWNL